MGCDIDFYRLNRETLKSEFIKLEESNEFISFINYINQANIVEQRTYSYSITDARIIIQKIKKDSLLLKRSELDDILDYIYETAVGKRSQGYQPNNKRFVEKMKLFGFELVYDISHGCASLFLLGLGDSDVLKSYEFWDEGERDSLNLKKEEFLDKLDYIILLHAKLQLMDCNDPDEKEEFLLIIKDLEKNEFLNKVVQNDLRLAVEDKKLRDNSSSLLYNAKDLKNEFKKIDDDIVIFYS